MTADVPLMKTLVKLGADPRLPNAQHCTPLMAAAGVGCLAPGEEAGTEDEALEAVKLALELGNDVNAVDDNGETAMHGAAYKSFPKVVQLLADKGAKIEVWNRKNKYGWTPLLIAEGHRPGNFKPSPETIAALQRVMLAAGVTPPPSATHRASRFRRALCAGKSRSAPPRRGRAPSWPRADRTCPGPARPRVACPGHRAGSGSGASRAPWAAPGRGSRRCPTSFCPASHHAGNPGWASEAGPRARPGRRRGPCKGPSGPRARREERPGRRRSAPVPCALGQARPVQGRREVLTVLSVPAGDRLSV